MDECDPVALAVMEQLTKDLSYCTASVLNLLAPGAVLFGGFMDIAGRWRGSLLKRCRASLSPFFEKTPPLRSGSGNNAALWGWAWLAVKKAGVL